jgi:metal-sulfur cluster biosynthetic enzyme
MRPELDGGDRDRALRALEDVLDPEIGENIVDLGLVQCLEIDAERVALTLVLTSPTCPMGGAIVDDAQRALELALPGRDVSIDVAENVPWGPERMSAVARERLGWDDGSS